MECLRCGNRSPVDTLVLLLVMGHRHGKWGTGIPSRCRHGGSPQPQHLVRRGVWTNDGPRSEPHPPSNEESIPCPLSPLYPEGHGNNGLLQVITSTRPLHHASTGITTPGRHETCITTVTTCPHAQSRIHAGDTGEQDTTRHPDPVKRCRTGLARTPRRQVGTFATTQPVIQRHPASRPRDPTHLCTAACHSPTASPPTRSYLAGRAADAMNTCTSNNPSPPWRPARNADHQVVRNAPALRSEANETRQRGRRGTTRGAGRAGVGPGSAVILGRIVTTLPGRGHGWQGIVTTGESVRFAARR